MSNLTLQEQETILTMSADDRNTWHVYSDDEVMQRRLEAIGATFIRNSGNGVGKFYELHADKVLLRKGKPKRGPLSDKQREALQRSQFRPKTRDGNGSETE